MPGIETHRTRMHELHSDTAPCAGAAPLTRAPDGLADFLAVRNRLLGIATRVLGRGGDAEDVVQDAWLRWNRTDRSVVRNANAFLSLTTARLSVGVTRSAHARHRSSFELLVERPDPDADPAVALERDEGLRTAVLMLVERLTPRERVAFVLREAFGYSHRDLGDVLGVSEANARQVLRRARARLSEHSPRPASAAHSTGHQPAGTAQSCLRDAFVQLAHTGNPSALAKLAQDPA